MAAARLQRQTVHVINKPCDEAGNGCMGQVLGDAVAECTGRDPRWHGGYVAGRMAIDNMASGPGRGCLPTYNDTHTKDECVAMLLRCAKECGAA